MTPDITECRIYVDSSTDDAIVIRVGSAEARLSIDEYYYGRETYLKANYDLSLPVYLLKMFGARHDPNQTDAT
jgi:hypothetical protein